VVGAEQTRAADAEFAQYLSADDVVAKTVVDSNRHLVTAGLVPVGGHLPAEA
jgi:hypothetical protein